MVGSQGSAHPLPLSSPFALLCSPIKASTYTKKYVDTRTPVDGKVCIFLWFCYFFLVFISCVKCTATTKSGTPCTKPILCDNLCKRHFTLKQDSPKTERLNTLKKNNKERKMEVSKQEKYYEHVLALANEGKCLLVSFFLFVYLLLLCSTSLKYEEERSWSQVSRSGRCS